MITEIFLGFVDTCFNDGMKISQEDLSMQVEGILIVNYLTCEMTNQK